MYRHQTGNPIPGIYEYSFALDNNPNQPSGSLNGSMFNKTILRNTYILPPYSSAAQGINPATGQPIGTICVLKSTASSPNPVIVNPNATDAYGRLIYKPNELVAILNKNMISGGSQPFQYTYTTRVYVQSYNFLRIIGGISNVVFSS